jgi:hypothetical protein
MPSHCFPGAAEKCYQRRGTPLQLASRIQIEMPASRTERRLRVTLWSSVWCKVTLSTYMNNTPEKDELSHYTLYTADTVSGALHSPITSESTIGYIITHTNKHTHTHTHTHTYIYIYIYIYNSPTWRKNYSHWPCRKSRPHLAASSQGFSSESFQQFHRYSTQYSMRPDRWADIGTPLRLPLNTRHKYRLKRKCDSVIKKRSELKVRGNKNTFPAQRKTTVSDRNWSSYYRRYVPLYFITVAIG